MLCVVLVMNLSWRSVFLKKWETRASWQRSPCIAEPGWYVSRACFEHMFRLIVPFYISNPTALLSVNRWMLQLWGLLTMFQKELLTFVLMSWSRWYKTTCYRLTSQCDALRSTKKILKHFDHRNISFYTHFISVYLTSLKTQENKRELFYLFDLSYISMYHDFLKRNMKERKCGLESSISLLDIFVSPS